MTDDHREDELSWVHRLRAHISTQLFIFQMLKKDDIKKVWKAAKLIFLLIIFLVILANIGRFIFTKVWFHFWPHHLTSPEVDAAFINSMFIFFTIAISVYVSNKTAQIAIRQSRSTIRDRVFEEKIRFYPRLVELVLHLKAKHDLLQPKLQQIKSYEEHQFEDTIPIVKNFVQDSSSLVEEIQSVVRANHIFISNDIKNNELEQFFSLLPFIQQPEQFQVIQRTQLKQYPTESQTEWDEFIKSPFPDEQLDLLYLTHAHTYFNRSLEHLQLALEREVDISQIHKDMKELLTYDGAKKLGFVRRRQAEITHFLEKMEDAEEQSQSY